MNIPSHPTHVPPRYTANHTIEALLIYMLGRRITIADGAVLSVRFRVLARSAHNANGRRHRLMNRDDTLRSNMVHGRGGLGIPRCDC